MEELLDMMLKDVAKMGTYIVCTTSNATRHLEEQYRKAGVPTDESKAMASAILDDLHITLGEPYLTKGKLTQLLAAHLGKEQRIGLKNYIFALRNLLSHSSYKEQIKAIEKPSLKLTESARFLAYVEERFDEKLDAHTKDTYSLLYTFVQACTMINRIWSVDPKSEEYDIYSLLMPQLVNPAMAALKQRVELPQVEGELKATYTIIEQDEVVENWLHSAQIYLQDIDVASFLEGQIFVDGKHASIALLAKMLQDVSDQYIAVVRTPVQSVKESAQKVKKVQAIKPMKTEKQWQKELYELQKERDELKSQNQQLNDKIKQLEQQQLKVTKELLELKDENKQLSDDFAQLIEEPTVSKHAVDVMQQLGRLVGELQQELLKEPEQVVVEDQTFIDHISGLRLAIVGGHQKYHAQLKTALKNEQLLCINPDTLNFDPKKLLSYDVVVFISGYSNHSLYNKAFDYLKRNGEKDKCLMLKTQPTGHVLAERIFNFINGVDNNK